MTREQHHSDSPRPLGISRQAFLKLAAMAGLLAGCRPVRQVVVTATPTPSATLRASATPVPTNTPTPTPASTLTPTPTLN